MCEGEERNRYAVRCRLSPVAKRISSISPSGEATLQVLSCRDGRLPDFGTDLKERLHRINGPTQSLNCLIPFSSSIPFAHAHADRMQG
jgi:hypothetical protein